MPVCQITDILRERRGCAFFSSIKDSLPSMFENHCLDISFTFIPFYPPTIKDFNMDTVILLIGMLGKKKETILYYCVFSFFR